MGDLMTVRERFALLRPWDFSDVPGSPADWVNLEWHRLPRPIRDILRLLTTRT